MNLILESSELPGGIRLLKLQGNIDLMGVNAVSTRFYAYCGGESPQVSVDLSAVGFVASLGIGMLLQAAKTVKARGGQLQFINPTPAVLSTLEISGLSQFVSPGNPPAGTSPA
jgi:anti-anti-sigma factor